MTIEPNRFYWHATDWQWKEQRDSFATVRFVAPHTHKH